MNKQEKKKKKKKKYIYIYVYIRRNSVDILWSIGQ